MTTPSTESPRNSRRSLVGSPPFSYAYERCVRASSSSSGLRIGSPSAARRSAYGCCVKTTTASDDLAAVDPGAVLTALGAGAVRQVLGAAGRVRAGHQRRRDSLPRRATVARV